MASDDIGLASRITAEAVRHIEQDGEPLAGSPQVERAVQDSGGSVEQRIVQRARQLATEAGVATGLKRVRSYARLLSYGAMVLVLLLGGLAALQAFDRGQAVVNFYWLLLVLLGFNLFSLVFWLVGLWASKTPTAGLLGQSATFLIRRWMGKTARPGANDSRLASAWLGVMLGGPPGRWSLSSLGHVLWAGYLGGGLAMILLLLAARQYDFVWETTLLGEQTFIPLTRALAWLPSQLGLTVPNLEQISQSRLGADPLLLAEARQAWASLLIASLLLYGVLPRLVLYGLCRLLQGRALRNFRLDTSRPYYVRLRQRLMPAATTIGVVDADRSAGNGQPADQTPNAEQAVPADASWLGIELGPEDRWPPTPLADGKDLGRIADRQGQHRALGRVGKLESTLVIAVPMHRSPDRGLARIIGELVAAAPRASWLALLDSQDRPGTDSRERDARMVDWYALAANCGIEADHISRLITAAGDARGKADD